LEILTAKSFATCFATFLALDSAPTEILGILALTIPDSNGFGESTDAIVDTFAKTSAETAAGGGLLWVIVVQ
jgi:hypothetical protein